MTFISVGSTGVGEADHAVTAAGTGLGGLLYALISEEAGAKNSVDSHVARQIVEVRGVEQTGRGLGQGQTMTGRYSWSTNRQRPRASAAGASSRFAAMRRSEEHTSELQSLMRI